MDYLRNVAYKELILMCWRKTGILALSLHGKVCFCLARWLGKTLFITSLVKRIEKIISLFLGENNRTKVTVDYHLVSFLFPEEQDLMSVK